MTGRRSTLPFEVRGRAAPELVMVDSASHAGTQDALLAWQTRVADWWHDRNQGECVAEYGPSLAVLVSRAGGPASGVADALRWRLHGDDDAAQRAGLTGEERTWLSTPEVVPAEFDVLDKLDGTDDESALVALTAALLPIIALHPRVVVFCGRGGLAVSLGDRLRNLLPEGRVGEHTAGTSAESCEQLVSRWRERGGILVADGSAEDGLNLQQADAVVHCRLPWSPNRLEQRLGRVDRHVGIAPRSLAHPARQYVLAHADAEDCFSGAWLALLTGGFAIFTESVSTLQDAIEQGLAEVWSTAATDGPQALARRADAVRDGLAAERRQIDGMDLLESVHESVSGMRDVAAAVGALELRWRDVREALVGYAGNHEGGLRFFPRQVGPANLQTVRFERGPMDPLMPPRLFARAGVALRQSLMEGVFNRTVALRLTGTRLFRCGHPFVDLLSSVIAIDDRGQAAALWRRDPRHQGDPAVYFGLDYLVEADVDTALAMVSEAPAARHALRRQADRILTPFLRRVWVPAGDETAVGNRGLVTWLDRPYHPASGDVNLNADRITDLVDLFGDRERFAVVARLADQTGRDELSRVTDLAVLCEQARDHAQRSLAVGRAQAQARRAAGRLVTDTDSYLMDVDLTEALIAGLARPRLRLVSATCLVRGGVGAAGHVG